MAPRSAPNGENRFLAARDRVIKKSFARHIAFHMERAQGGPLERLDSVIEDLEAAAELADSARAHDGGLEERTPAEIVAFARVMSRTVASAASALRDVEMLLEVERDATTLVYAELTAEKPNRGAHG